MRKSTLLAIAGANGRVGRAAATHLFSRGERRLSCGKEIQKSLLTVSPFWITYQLVCMSNRTQVNLLPETKRKLLDAGVSLMRQRGFNATTVDEVCAEAGVTKGGFFHYFKTKDDLATAAVGRFYEVKAKQFADAPFRGLADPLDRILDRKSVV